MLGDHASDRAPASVSLQARHLVVHQQGDVRVLEGGEDRNGLGIGLGVHQARVAVAPGAADAGAGREVGLVEEDAAGCVKRVVAGFLQVVVDLLDPGLVADGRVRVLAAPGTLGGIVAMVAVDLVEPLGLGVPGLEVLVGERPGGRDAVSVFKLAEVTGAQAVEGGAIELRRAPYVVVDARLKCLAVLVLPRVGRGVAALDED